VGRGFRRATREGGSPGNPHTLLAVPIATSLDSYGAVRPRGWSYDAWALAQPRRAFRHLSGHLPPGSAWTAWRRPLFLALLIGCGMSVLAAGVLTLRIALTATLYWTYVPLAEILALAAATRGVRGISASQKIDAFFAGHAPVTLFLLALCGALSLQPGDQWWRILTGPAVWVWLVALVWGTYVDFCCFREVMQMTRARAVGALLLQRAISWALVFVVFAVPRPGLLIGEIVDSLRELI
jgi:hypothetical protein